MARLSRLEIVDKTLEYLRSNDVASAIKFLEDARSSILSEVTAKTKRVRKPLIERCKELIDKDRELANYAVKKAREMGITEQTT